MAVLVRIASVCIRLAVCNSDCSRTGPRGVSYPRLRDCLDFNQAVREPRALPGEQMGSESGLGKNARIGHFNALRVSGQVGSRRGIAPPKRTERDLLQKLIISAEQRLP